VSTSTGEGQSGRTVPWATARQRRKRCCLTRLGLPTLRSGTPSRARHGAGQLPHNPWHRSMGQATLAPREPSRSSALMSNFDTRVLTFLLSGMPSRSSLNVSLTPELTGYVAAQVASGRYRSASEVIRASLRLLQRDEPVGTPQPPLHEEGSSEHGRKRRRGSSSDVS
jgi:antitoxin ParD1/3/4